MAEPEESYDVRSIVGYRLIKGLIEYRVEFVTGEKEYVPLYNLRGTSRQLALEFKDSHNLNNYSDHQLNSSDADDHLNSETDRSNYCCMTDVLEQIRIHRRNLRRDPSLIVDDYPGPQGIPSEGNVIYLHLYKAHYYVYAYHRDAKKVYVADGINSVFESDIMTDLQEVTQERRLIPLQFMHEIDPHHCGSAAAVIALQLLLEFAKKNRRISRIRIRFHAAYKMIKKSLHRS